MKLRNQLLAAQLVEILLQRDAIGRVRFARLGREPADLPSRAGREQRLSDPSQRGERRRVERVERAVRSDQERRSLRAARCHVRRCYDNRWAARASNENEARCGP